MGSYKYIGRVNRKDDRAIFIAEVDGVLRFWFSKYGDYTPIEKDFRRNDIMEQNIVDSPSYSSYLFDLYLQNLEGL